MTTRTEEKDSRIAAGNAETARRAAEKFILGVHLDELALGYGTPKKALERLMRVQLQGMNKDDRRKILDGTRYYAPIPVSWTL